MIRVRRVRRVGRVGRVGRVRRVRRVSGRTLTKTDLILRDPREPRQKEDRCIKALIFCCPKVTDIHDDFYVFHTTMGLVMLMLETVTFS